MKNFNFRILILILITSVWSPAQSLSFAEAVKFLQSEINNPAIDRSVYLNKNTNYEFRLFLGGPLHLNRIKIVQILLEDGQSYFYMVGRDGKFERLDSVKEVSKLKIIFNNDQFRFFCSIAASFVVVD